jgi:hypothetical protein
LIDIERLKHQPQGIGIDPALFPAVKRASIIQKGG